MDRDRGPPDMKASQAAPVGLMDRYLRGLFDPCVALPEVHKMNARTAGRPPAAEVEVHQGTLWPPRRGPATCPE